MSTGTEKSDCEKRCWQIALAVGVVLFLLLWIFGAGYLWGLLLGIAAFTVVGLALILLRCRGVEAKPEPKPAAEPKAVPEAKPAPAPEVKAEAKAEPAPAPKPEAKPAPAPAAESAPQPDAPEGPARLSAARDGQADDLKQIKGVGPKLESVLHEKGFYHFDQIAAWTEAEVAWVDENLEGFKGRVSRDDWVAQAKILAAGGDTEFSKRTKS